MYCEALFHQKRRFILGYRSGQYLGERASSAVILDSGFLGWWFTSEVRICDGGFEIRVNAHLQLE
jgi:hypothetical protein